MSRTITIRNHDDLVKESTLARQQQHQRSDSVATNERIALCLPNVLSLLGDDDVSLRSDFAEFISGSSLTSLYVSMSERNNNNISVEDLARVLRLFIPPLADDNTCLESMELRGMFIEGELNVLAEVIGRFKGLRKFTIHYCFCDPLLPLDSDDDTIPLFPYVLPEALAHQLPNLEEIHWYCDFTNSAFPVTLKKEILTIFLQNKSIKKISVQGCNYCATNGDSFCTDNAEEFTILCAALRDSELEELKFVPVNIGWEPFYDFSTQYLEEIGKTVIEVNNTLQVMELSDLQPGTCIDPFVKSLCSNTTLKSIELELSIDPKLMEEPTIDVEAFISSESLDALIDWVQFDNCALHEFIVTLWTGRTLVKWEEWDGWDAERKQKIVTFNYYVELNKNFPRKRILTDPQFTKEDLLGLLPASDTDDKGLSNIFSLLLMKPALWIPTNADANATTSPGRNKLKRSHDQFLS